MPRKFTLLGISFFRQYDPMDIRMPAVKQIPKSLSFVSCIEHLYFLTLSTPKVYNKCVRIFRNTLYTASKAKVPKSSPYVDTFSCLIYLILHLILEQDYLSSMYLSNIWNMFRCVLLYSAFLFLQDLSLNKPSASG